jgi:hypothetical protein
LVLLVFTCSCLYFLPSSLVWVLGFKMFMSIVFLWFPNFYCKDKVHNFILNWVSS